MAPLTQQELFLFHKTDREVFCFLIFKLHRDVTQSLLVMALWLFLNYEGYSNIISQVMSLPYPFINALINEAVTCLNFLEMENPLIPPGGGLPLTKNLTNKYISLKFFTRGRYTFIAGIKSVLNNICVRVFSDILQIFLKSANITRASTSRNIALRMPLVVPGFPHPLFGPFDITPMNTLNLDLYDIRVWCGGRPCDDATDDEKSIFLTFSKGFPVSETEVIKVFTKLYGDCLERLTMGTVDANNQHLYAILFLNKVGVVDKILKGKRIAKLNCKGKHIWARKYERRD